MRRIFNIVALAVAVTFVANASAQQVVKQRIGVYKESGNVVVAEATTSLVVDLVVEYNICYCIHIQYLILSIP